MYVCLVCVLGYVCFWCVWMYVYVIYVCVCGCMCVDVCVWMYVCGCMFVVACVCLDVFIYMYISVCKWMYGCMYSTVCARSICSFWGFEKQVPNHHHCTGNVARKGQAEQSGAVVGSSSATEPADEVSALRQTDFVDHDVEKEVSAMDESSRAKFAAKGGGVPTVFRCWFRA